MIGDKEQKGEAEMDFMTHRYTVERIDGDYAYLKNEDRPADDEKCVARALLPQDISEGSRLLYENLQYSMI